MQEIQNIYNYAAFNCLAFILLYLRYLRYHKENRMCINNKIKSYIIIYKRFF